jgi:hypothetical protein
MTRLTRRAWSHDCNGFSVLEGGQAAASNPDKRSLSTAYMVINREDTSDTTAAPLPARLVSLREGGAGERRAAEVFAPLPIGLVCHRQRR